MSAAIKPRPAWFTKFFNLRDRWKKWNSTRRVVTAESRRRHTRRKTSWSCRSSCWCIPYFFVRMVRPLCWGLRKMAEFCRKLHGTPHRFYFLWWKPFRTSRLKKNEQCDFRTCITIDILERFLQQINLHRSPLDKISYNNIILVPHAGEPVSPQYGWPERRLRFNVVHFLMLRHTGRYFRRKAQGSV